MKLGRIAGAEKNEDFLFSVCEVDVVDMGVDVLQRDAGKTGII